MKIEPGFYEMMTVHGTRVVASQDGTVAHSSSSDAGKPLAVFVPRSAPDYAILSSAHQKMELSIVGLAEPGELVLFRMQDHEGKVILKHASTDQALVPLAVADEVGSFKIAEASDDPEAALFTLAPCEAPKFQSAQSMRPLLILDRSDRLRDPAALRQEAASTEYVGLALCLVEMLDADALRQVVPALSGGPCYERVFQAVKRRLAQSAPGRPFNPKVAWGQHWDWGSAGAHSYGSPAIDICPGGKLFVGRYTVFGPDVAIYLGEQVSTAAATFPFQSEHQQWPSRQTGHFAQEFYPRDVVIGNNVWIGAKVVILAGTVIGDGAIIEPGACLSGAVPSYTVHAGNPGRHIKDRFPSEITERLLEIAWWNWPDHQVDRFSGLLLDPDINQFLAAVEREYPRPRKEDPPLREKLKSAATAMENIQVSKRKSWFRG